MATEHSSATTNVRWNGESRRCPLCDSTASRPLERYSTSEWHVVSCTACSFVYLSNPPHYEDLESNFAWESTSVAESARRASSRPLLTRLDRATRWRLHMLRRSREHFYRDLFRQGRVLDIGCGGSAGPPEPLVPFGIEISRVLFEQSKLKMAERGGYAVHGAAAEAITQFPDRFFAGVIMSSVVEHEKQPKKLLLNVARVLENEGKAYIRVPNFGSVNRVLMDSKWCGFRYPDHVNYFTVATLKRMAAECGLRLRLLNPGRLPFDDNINAVLEQTLNR